MATREYITEIEWKMQKEEGGKKESKTRVKEEKEKIRQMEEGKGG